MSEASKELNVTKGTIYEWVRKHRENCNKLMLMWCVKKGENSKTIELDVSLNRRGNTGVTLLKFSEEKMQFTELETKYNENKNVSEPESDWRQKFYQKRF